MTGMYTHLGATVSLNIFDFKCTDILKNVRQVSLKTGDMWDSVFVFYLRPGGFFPGEIIFNH